MTTFLGLVAAVFVLLYKRATEIVTVHPLDGVNKSPINGMPQGFGQVLGALRDAAAEAAKQAEQQQRRNERGPNARRSSPNLPSGKSEQGRAAIRMMVQNNQFVEAIQVYRRMYGVDLETAKKAVDTMMLEQ